MSVFDMVFGKRKQKKQLFKYFELLNGYTPVFTTFDGGVYEMELTRACIGAFARHASKLTPSFSGADSLGIEKIISPKVNPWMTTSQFIYRVATILDATNTCYLIPLLDKYDDPVGCYPIQPRMTEIVEDEQGQQYLRYTFAKGQKAAIELSRVGILTNYQYTSDYQGEDNRALQPTMDLINTQNQGIAEGIKTSAAYRFMATLSNLTKSKDVKEERKRFTEENFSAEDGGMLLFPNTYSNVQQIKSQAQIIDPEQVKTIEERAFKYFGCNLDILENKAVGDAWSAYYEGKIEPFAIQLSEVMTSMFYTPQMISGGNAIVWSSNRLQYMTNADKLSVSAQMFDRGIFNRNMIMDIWNLPHVEDGDLYYIRKEYTEIQKLEEGEQKR